MPSLSTTPSSIAHGPIEASNLGHYSTLSTHQLRERCAFSSSHHQNTLLGYNPNRITPLPSEFKPPALSGYLSERTSVAATLSGLAGTERHSATESVVPLQPHSPLPSTPPQENAAITKKTTDEPTADEAAAATQTKSLVEEQEEEGRYLGPCSVCKKSLGNTPSRNIRSCARCEAFFHTKCEESRLYRMGVPLQLMQRQVYHCAKCRLHLVLTGHSGLETAEAQSG